MSYYNTTNLSGKDLSRSIEQANKQEEIVMAIFRSKNKPLSPVDVHKVYCTHLPQVPITSIRRAITNLTDQGKLIKTDLTGMGEYGKINYKWKLAV